MAFPWAFCASPFRQLLSELSAVLFSHSAAVHARTWQTHNSCPLPTMLRYVKPMQSVWVHSSFALTFLLRTSRNLDCNKTPRLQNKTHNLINSNHSKISNPMLTWQTMLWNSGMSQFSEAATGDLAMVMKSIPIILSFLMFSLQKWRHHDFAIVAYMFI